MQVEIIAIGNEVLNGSVANTNAQMISAHLKRLGLTIVRHQVIEDKMTAIIEAIQAAITYTPLTIFTGGLGPTVDDLTKQAAAQALQCPLRRDEAVFQELKSRYPDYPYLHQQAEQLQGATLFKNRIGSAYGFACKKNGNAVVFLPGVPFELEALLDEEVIPWIRSTFSLQAYAEKQLCILLKKEHQINPSLIALSQEGLECGIYPNYGYCHVLLKSLSAQKLEQAVLSLQHQFKTSIVTESVTLTRGLVDLLIDRNLTLAAAESCTGGAVSKLLTQQEGVSEVFAGSIVCYSNASKVQLLGVDPSCLEKEGAVSAPCAGQMAARVKEKFQSSVGISVTGIAGPSGGTVEKPVGTVWMAIACDQGVFVGKLPAHPFTKREIIVSYSANYLLASLYRFLKYQQIPFE